MQDNIPAQRLSGSESLEEFQKQIHKCAVEHGWWDKNRHMSEMLINVAGEVLELWEAYRKGEIHMVCDKDTASPLTALQEELADIVIRVLDIAGHFGLDMAECIAIKHNYNMTRSYRHGNKLG